MSTSCKRPRRGFTLVELIVVVVILAVLAAIITPSFNLMIYRFKYRATVTEATALAREALDHGLLERRFHITTPDFRENDLDRSTEGTQTASGTTPWSYTSQHEITVYIQDNGDVTSDEAGDVIVGSARGGAMSTNPTPTPSSTPSGGADLGITSLDGTATINGLGTFVDSFNGLTITRSANGVTLTFDRANWEFVETNHATTDTLYKVSGPSTVGVNQKNSNTDVSVSLGSGSAFTIRVKFNGGSTGAVYNFLAV